MSNLNIFLNEKTQQNLSLIREKMEGFKKFIQETPQLNEFLTNLSQDPLAIPSLMRIIENRTHLIIFAAANIAIIILSFLWKRSISKNINLTNSSRFARQLFRIILIKFAQVGFLAFYWKEEFYPTWIIFRKSFLE